MEIKEEILKEAYGELFEANRKYINPDGWCTQTWLHVPNCPALIWYKDEFENTREITEIKNSQTHWMPTKLYNSIALNEGWSKLGNQRKIKDGPCWIKREGGNVTIGQIKGGKFYFLDEVRPLKGVTHYQRVRKPKEPIY